MTHRSHPPSPTPAPTASTATDGDDYIEGNAGNDVIFGNQGQDDLIGGSSSLFSLATPALRLDGADLVFGGSGTQIARNDPGDATTQGHAKDSDAIAGDNANIYRLVGINGVSTGQFLTFNYDNPIFASLASVSGDVALDVSTPRAALSLFLGRGTISVAPNRINGEPASDTPPRPVTAIPGFDPARENDRTVMPPNAVAPLAPLRIIPRAVQFLDYTPGGPDYTPAVEPAPLDIAINPSTGVRDIGGADEIHGESGDDVIYGMVGGDILFGDGQDDNIVAGYGADWISGGAGDDGILGDDGRIFVSRNSTSFGEPLYGIAAIAAAEIDKVIQVQNGTQFAITNVTNQLKYTVDLTPFSVDPSNAAPSTLMPRPLYSNDMIFGGLGNDSLHAGAGEDAISGAEAQVLSFVANYNQNGTKLSAAAVESDFAHPVNPGNVLGYNPATTNFALYDAAHADHGRRKVLLNADGSLSLSSTTGPNALEWAFNFNHTEGPIDTFWIQGQNTFAGVATDGDDRIFGDVGHDWLVGGTGRDSLWGGWGDDVLNADDVLTTHNGLNDQTDTNPSYEDFLFGGAGRDVININTNGDRGIDWVGEFNTFLTPFGQFGADSVQRLLNPALPSFLLAVSKSQGADQTLAAQFGSSAARNGEPFGELGLVLQQDAAFNDQAGAPRDPQGGNLPGGKVDVPKFAGTKPLR
jgi:Ca2+-binding RTX toxin-like protein